MQTLESQSALPPDLMKRIVWRLAPLMVLMYVANQLDRANGGYGAHHEHRTRHNHRAVRVIGKSVFFWAILCEVPSNLCMHRFGARRWMTRILVSWGLLSSLTSFVPDAHWLYVAGPLMVSAVTLASALYLSSPLATVAVLAIGTSACFCSISTFWQMLSHILTDRAAAAGIALITSIGVSSGFLMPYFIGWIRDTTGTFQLAFIAIATAMTIGSALAIALDPERRRVPATGMA